MVWGELIVLLLVVGLVCLAVAIAGSPAVRSALLTVFGVLGLLLIVGVALFYIRSRVVEQHLVYVQGARMSAGEPEIVDQIDLRTPTEPKTSKGEKSKRAVMVAKKPAISTDSTAIEELPIRPAEEIRIDEQMRAEIEQQWREAQLHDRLLYTGITAGTLICLLATLFGYLKFDLLSQAKHRRSLQAGAAGVILAVALVAALAAEGRLGF